MILIDIDTISITFSGDYHLLTGTTLKAYNKSTNTTYTFPLNDIYMYNNKYTEYTITGITELFELEDGQYHYEFLNGTTILDNGIMKVNGVSLTIPVYTNTMDTYVTYKNI